MKILFPDSIESAPISSSQTAPGAQFVAYDRRLPIPIEHHDARGLVVWLNSPKQLSSCVQDLSELQWVQSLASGTDNLVSAGFGARVQICSGAGLHNGPVAEHALALILAATRRVDLLLDAQREHRWAKELSGPNTVGPQHGGSFPGLGSLLGARALIVGFGEIGRTLAPLLLSLGAQVSAVASRARVEDGIEVFTLDELPNLVAKSDLVINILPSTSETVGLFDATVFAKFLPHAWFFNVGRGKTVVENDLIAALNNNVIAGAGLDVFEREPLSSEEPIWLAKNLITSPHSGGGRPQNYWPRIIENYNRFIAGADLINAVNTR